jgi:hypothetical protein
MLTQLQTTICFFLHGPSTNMSLTPVLTASTPTSRRSSTRPPTLTTTALPLYVTTTNILSNDLGNKKSTNATYSLQIANPSVAALYEDALVYETGTAITSSGALTAYSGAKTGRSPLDKRIVKEPSSENHIWWGPVNKPMSPEVSFPVLRFRPRRHLRSAPSSTRGPSPKYATPTPRC